MKKLVLPKQTGELEPFYKSIEIYYKSSKQGEEWLANEKFKKLIKEKLRRGEDDAYLVKQSEMARYFGLVENQWDENRARITERGKRFHDFANPADKIDLLFESMAEDTFGRNNCAVQSADSCIEPPIILLKAILKLGSLKKKEEYSYILYRMHDNDDDFNTVIELIKKGRTDGVNFANEIPKENKKYTDPKDIVLFENIGLLSRNHGDYVIADDLKKRYEPLIKTISPYNTLVKSLRYGLQVAGFVHMESLPINYLSALLTKPFIILTGLSGSGKTKFAHIFTKWITEIKVSKEALLNRALGRKEIQEKYEVIKNATHYLEVVNRDGSSKKIIPLPKGAIYEWYESIKTEKIGANLKSTDIQKAKDVFDGLSIYQKYIHGFYVNLYDFGQAMYLADTEIGKSVTVSSNKQYGIVSVGSDWTNNENIIGYPDALDKKKYIKTQALDIILRSDGDRNKPYFLILDEMNLSHVERYFSDFLSSIESKEPLSLHSDQQDRQEVPPAVSLPNNLFVVGTVNVDETTYMFSPKVLDRANVIEFRVSGKQMKNFAESPRIVNMDAIEGSGAKYAAELVNLTNNHELNMPADIKKMLQKELNYMFEKLEKYGMEFGYRTAYEINKFITVYYNLTDESTNRDINNAVVFRKAMDAQIVQKILPKLNGSRKKLIRLLNALAWNTFYGDDPKREEYYKKKEFEQEKNIDELLLQYENAGAEYTVGGPFYPVSFNKISRMIRSLNRNGFVSFAEA